MKINKVIKREGASAAIIFDHRTVENDYATLIPLLKEGLRVLDVGCGTGAISRGVAGYVGKTGFVTGIDHTESFILSGKESYGSVENLKLIHADLFDFEPEEKFDLIVSARVLQWLSNPKEAIAKMKAMLKPAGMVSILDYNHSALEWKPDPPSSMICFYNIFLKWRADAGMNNRIAEDLAGYFKELNFDCIEVLEANEVYKKGEENFKFKAGIWSKVAGLTQLVEEGYLQNEDRLKAIEEYDQWIETEAEFMVLKLKEVRGKIYHSGHSI
jgi:ubiquinone/menaquinone biosynthesis C-methylase UbiE